MNTHPGLDKAQAYLSAQLGGSRPGWLSHPDGPFVTLSRESGAGGSSLAQTLADVLSRDETPERHWRVFDGNLIDAMLERNHLEPRLAQYLPEDSVSEINASVGELVGLHPSLWQLVQKTNDMIRQLAQGGRVIIVGRGANFATAALPSGVHVRLIAPPDHRAELMARLEQRPVSEARESNERKDFARQRYVRATFNADVALAAAYDLVINTGRVSLNQAADLVASLVRLRTPMPA